MSKKHSGGMDDVIEERRGRERSIRVRPRRAAAGRPWRPDGAARSWPWCGMLGSARRLKAKYNVNEEITGNVMGVLR